MDCVHFSVISLMYLRFRGLSNHTNLSAKTNEKFPSNSWCRHSSRRKVILKLVCGVVLAIKASNTEQNCKLGVCLDEIVLVALIHLGCKKLGNFIPLT